MKISEFQSLIAEQFLEKDRARGVDGTFVWFVEEIGELARALKGQDRANEREEFADILAWLCSLASIRDIDLEAAVREKYGAGCPRCGATPCACPPRHERPDADSGTMAGDEADDHSAASSPPDKDGRREHE